MSDFIDAMGYDDYIPTYPYPDPYLRGYDRDMVTIMIEYWEWITTTLTCPRRSRVPRVRRQGVRSDKEADHG